MAQTGFITSFITHVILVYPNVAFWYMLVLPTHILNLELFNRPAYEQS